MTQVIFFEVLIYYVHVIGFVARESECTKCKAH
jgi:hypothetical protein